ERNELSRVFLHGGARAVAPAIVQTSVLPAPAQLLQRLSESSHAILSFSIMSGEWGEYTNVTHALALLPARHERPRRSRASDQRDELATFHCPVAPVLPNEGIAHPVTAALRDFDPATSYRGGEDVRFAPKADITRCSS